MDKSNWINAKVMNSSIYEGEYKVGDKCKIIEFIVAGDKSICAIVLIGGFFRIIPITNLEYLTEQENGNN